MGRNVLALSQAYAATGQVRRALESLLDATRDPAECTLEGAHGWLPLREQLAQLYRQTGDSASAEPVEAELRARLAFADADHPIRRRLASSLVATVAAR